MTDLTGLPEVLAKALEGLPENAATAPVAGELWTLAWDGQYLGLALIAEVKDGYIFAWPVTLPGEAAFAPALKIHSTPLQLGLYVWPTRETGIGFHLLDRPLGSLISAGQINQLARATRRGEATRYPYAEGHADDPENQAQDAAMVERWADLCFMEWPDGQDIFLSEAGIKAAGGTPAQAARVLGADVGTLRAYWEGQRPVSPDQAHALAHELGVTIDDIASADPLPEVMQMMSSPLYKGQIMARSRKEGVSEGTMRNLVRADFMLAARDDSTSLAEGKLRDAIARAKPYRN